MRAANRAGTSFPALIFGFATIPLVSDQRYEELKRRLKEGEYLEVRTTGGVYEVWAEPYANPPAVYYEGEMYPITELDQVCEKLLAASAAGEASLRWVEMD